MEIISKREPERKDSSRNPDLDTRLDEDSITNSTKRRTHHDGSFERLFRLLPINQLAIHPLGIAITNTEVRYCYWVHIFLLTAIVTNPNSRPQNGGTRNWPSPRLFLLVGRLLVAPTSSPPFSSKYGSSSSITRAPIFRTTITISNHAK